MRTFRSVCMALALLGLVAGPALALNCAKPVHILSIASEGSQPAPSRPLELPLLPFGLAGAIRIKDTGTIAKKFSQRAQGATSEYTAGVQAAGADWAANAKAGEDNYKQGVNEAMARGAYGKGIDAAGASKYVDNASKLGSQRYAPGVANAEGAYARGVQPHLDMMKSLDLPAKGPKGSPQNQQRAAVVAARNRALKVGK